MAADASGHYYDRQEPLLWGVLGERVRNGLQLSLFGTELGKGHLFAEGALDRYLSEHKTTPITGIDEHVRLVRRWLDALAGTDATEVSLELQFVNDILCGVLGYRAYPGPSASLYVKPPTRITGIKGTPDVMLGEFAGQEHHFGAVLELKSPGAKLDAPQPGYGNITPVDQAFEYGRRILGVRWVVVSDMRVIRLYSVESPGEYEEINLGQCVTPTGQGTDQLRRLHFLLHYDYLIAGHGGSQVALLHDKSAARQLEIREQFYQAYYDIRADLYDALRHASAGLTPVPGRSDLLEATQRLLDRLLFIFYCEDHPQQLIPDQTVKRVIEAARTLPGPSTGKVYGALKDLFREVDAGSPPASGIRVSGYNGELFKEHWILDHVDLPDTLHDKSYGNSNGARRVRGVWGLHEYDFWIDLNEHVLGHIFEESLSDLEDLGTDTQKPLSEKLRERKKSGIYYTTDILSDFLCASAIRATLGETAPIDPGAPDELVPRLRARLDHLLDLRVVDFACGSGAFLVSVYQEMLQEFSRVRSSLDALSSEARTLETLHESATQAGLLRNCVFGVDLLPQATEIAKLASWLRSAQKGEKVADLGGNILAADSLDIEALFAKLGRGPGTFDIVVGNPPWGGEVPPAVYEMASRALGATETGLLDSWELFLLLALRALRPGGRLGLVLPDSFLYPEKARTRRALLESATIEKIHYLGPDWFGEKVRMSTVVVQAKKGAVDLDARISCLLLSGELRRDVIRGKTPLTQAEAQRSRLVPVRRVWQSPATEVEVFRGERDDRIMERMVERGTRLEALCIRGRGEEMGKTGLLWECPSCLTLNTPGVKQKGGGFQDKPCSNCGHTLTEGAVGTSTLVVDGQPPFSTTGSGGVWVPFIDGDDVNRRYQKVVPSKRMWLDESRWTHKNSDLYRPPKILVRQAGVGLSATLDSTDARCPQSVYIYRLRNEALAAGYRHEFVLGALLSRTMAYFVLKRFAEVDPAKAFAKLTHTRLADLPVPTVDFSDAAQREAHDSIVSNVEMLLSGSAHLGGKEDLAVEKALRDLWGISSVDGAYINGEFWDLPDSQPIRDLFPNGRARPIAPAAGGDAG